MFKKFKITLLSSFILFIFLFSSSVVFAMPAIKGEKAKAEYVEKIKNINISYTEGILLHTESKIIYENAKKYNIVNKGKKINDNIRIKDGILQGFIKDGMDYYLISGKLDDVNLKYNGKVENHNGYTFEAYIIDADKGYILINIFDDKNMPKSYKICDERQETYRTIIDEDTYNYLETNNISTTLTSSTNYYQNLKTVDTSGIWYKIEGPLSQGNSGSQSAHNIQVRTKSQQAYNDSFTGTLYSPISKEVYNLNMKFTPPSGSVFFEHVPNSSNSTTLNVSFFLPFAPELGIISLPVTTSSTSLLANGTYVNAIFGWSPGSGYIDDSSTTYTSGKKTFGMGVYYNVNSPGYVGYKTPWIDITMQYRILAKQLTTGGPNVSAYPSYSSSAPYNISITN